jgi:CcmD family protein
VTPLAWMFLGYSAMWLLIVLYVGNLGRRQAALERELAGLRAALEGEPGAGPDGEAAGREPDGVGPREP